MSNRILSSLIEKISNYATRINSEAGFVDKSWTYIDEDGQTVRLLFKANGRLLINQKGRVTEGSWEFIAQWGGLLVEIDGVKSLYNQAMVFDDVVMLLKIDGTEDYLPLSDDKAVLPGAIEKFLEKIQEKSLIQSDGAANKEQVVRKYRLSSGEEITVRGRNDNQEFKLVGAYILHPKEYSEGFSGELNFVGDFTMLVSNGEIVGSVWSTKHWGIFIAIFVIIVILIVIW